MPDSTCKWPGCERPARTRGFCQRDYQRGKTQGNLTDPWLDWTGATPHPQPPECRWPGCSDSPRTRGLCSMHYGRGDRMGNLSDPWLTWQQFPECVTCGGSFQASRATQKYCSRECSRSFWIDDNRDRYRDMCARAASVRRARTRTVLSEPFTVAEVRDARGDDCYLCSRPIDFALRYPNPLAPSLDHIKPISLGGGHVLSNVAMTHLVCNIRKGNRQAATPPEAIKTT